MSDDEERVNETEEMRIDSAIIKLAEQYAALENRAKAINEEKKQIRENVDKLGIPSLAWQIGVKTVKLYSKTERADFSRGLKRVTTALGERQRELWPEAAERIAQRQAKAKEAADAAKAKAGPDTDTNPRSDPARGGAGKKRQTPAAAVAAGAAASDAALAASIAANEAREQAAGGAMLDGAIADMKGSANG